MTEQLNHAQHLRSKIEIKSGVLQEADPDNMDNLPYAQFGTLLKRLDLAQANM